MEFHECKASMYLNYFTNKYFKLSLCNFSFKLFIMCSVPFKRSPHHVYPEIELDMTNFMEQLSDENIYGNGEVIDCSIQANPKVINHENRDSIDMGKITSTSGIKLEQEDMVRKFNLEFE